MIGSERVAQASVLVILPFATRDGCATLSGIEYDPSFAVALLLASADKLASTMWGTGPALLAVAAQESGRTSSVIMLAIFVYLT